MKKISIMLAFAAIGFATTAHAQSADMKNMLKVGISGGAAVPSENFSGAFGADVSYQYMVQPGFGLGLATGYTHYFAKENKDYKNNAAGLVPVAAMLRVYPKQTGFYFGTDLGYGFITGEDKVASNVGSVARPTGGFYVKPEIGFHNKDWNFSIQYQKVFTGDEGKMLNQNYNMGSIGAGVSYNIPLGN